MEISLKFFSAKSPCGKLNFFETKCWQPCNKVIMCLSKKHEQFFGLIYVANIYMCNFTRLGGVTACRSGGSVNIVIGLTKVSRFAI